MEAYAYAPAGMRKEKMLTMSKGKKAKIEMWLEGIGELGFRIINLKSKSG